MTDYLVASLREAIKDSSHKPLIVCGAGVSTQVTERQAPSWPQLIRSGVGRAIELDQRHEPWGVYAYDRLNNGTASEWIEVADEVCHRLGGADGGEFSRWLREQFSQLVVINSKLVDAIFSLDCLVATTNYDNLLSIYSGIPPINWTDYDATLEFLQGGRKGVLHLHGQWDVPGSVVLGSLSYDKHRQDQRRKLLQEMAALTRPTIFIGCGADGISDPDFTRLDTFISDWARGAPRRYWLIREKEQSSPSQLAFTQQRPGLFAVSYGADYDDLPDFLASLGQRPGNKSTAQLDGESVVKTVDLNEPEPQLFGRTDELDLLRKAFLSDTLAIVAGAPGIGKTALATAALYDEHVRAKFGEQRVLVSLDTSSEPRTMLSRLADALGIQSAGDEASLLRLIDARAASHPVAAVLDNAEGIFDADRVGAERLLRLAARIPGLALALTIRGVPPAVPAAVVIEDLSKLDEDAAREAFVAISGHSLRDDPDLPRLLRELDGHALSIQLIAAQAAGLPSIAGLLKAWDEARASILRRPDADEGRLTSVRASLALSLKSSRLHPRARRLLGVLSYLPAGLAEEEVRNIIADRGTLTLADVHAIVTPLHQLRLVERRPDRRLRMLTPLRESLKLDGPILPVDRKRLISRYLLIAAKGKMLGTSGWEQVRAEVDREAENIDPICELAVASLQDEISSELHSALMGLGNLERFVGRAGKRSLEKCADILRKQKPSAALSNILMCLGEIADSRSDHAMETAYFREGVQVAKGCGYKLGQANSILGLADVAMECSNHPEATRLYEQAREIYNDLKRPQSQANCLSKLGDMKVRGEFPESARPLFEEAAALYEKTGDLLGKANVVSDLAILNKDSEEVGLFEALGMYRKIGTPLGEVRCLGALGHIAVRKRNYSAAIKYFDEALMVARGNAMAIQQASLLVRRGMVLRVLGQDNGDSEVEEGFDLYFQVAHPNDGALPGFRAFREFLLSDDQARRAASYALARELWQKVDRFDLVREWLDPEADRRILLVA